MQIKLATDSLNSAGTEEPASLLKRSRRIFECTLSLGIPHDAIEYLGRLGSGSFGTCYRVCIHGITYFPSDINYVAKKYSGLDGQRYKSFEKEDSIDLRHSGIVRSIGHSRGDPWVTIFPFFNGRSVGELMQCLPFDNGTFKRIVKMEAGGGEVKDKGRVLRLSPSDFTQIMAFSNWLPSIIASLVQTMNFAHAQNVVHCDLHPFNIMLDFAKDCKPRIGVIDWGMAMRLGIERRTSLSCGTKSHKLRPWLAPELLTKSRNQRVYTKEVDIYALSWVIVEMITFCRELAMEHKTSWPKSESARQDHFIEKIVKDGYLLKKKNKKSLEELHAALNSMQLDSSKCLRPIVEMSPASY
ncbi:hypothetical protein L7F22_000015 [Adiantum nelumboides]|nr:hypothetical protein [Adiantum nelumboides]